MIGHRGRSFRATATILQDAVYVLDRFFWNLMAFATWRSIVAKQFAWPSQSAGPTNSGFVFAQSFFWHFQPSGSHPKDDTENLTIIGRVGFRPACHQFEFCRVNLITLWARTRFQLMSFFFVHWHDCSQCQCFVSPTIDFASVAKDRSVLARNMYWYSLLSAQAESTG